MLKKILSFLSMAGRSPVERTFVQAALPILVAAGTGWASVGVLKTAVIAGVAAVLSFGQARGRDAAATLPGPTDPTVQPGGDSV